MHYESSNALQKLQNIQSWINAIVQGVIASIIYNHLPTESSPYSWKVLLSIFVLFIILTKLVSVLANKITFADSRYQLIGDEQNNVGNSRLIFANKLMARFYKILYRFWAENKKSMLWGLLGLILGISIVSFYKMAQYEKLDMKKSSPITKQSEPKRQLPINSIIFNANNNPGSELIIGNYLKNKLNKFTFDTQKNWWMRTTYNNTIIVYISDKHDNQARQIAKLLDGQPIVFSYEETPFRGLEHRDIAIFVGKDFSNLRIKVDAVSHIFK